MAKTSQQATTNEPADIQAAAALVLERERERKERAATRARKQRRQRAKEQHFAIKRMLHSIEIIKWCIVGIATVMALGLIAGLITLMSVQSKVAEIERQAEQVREALRHPMQSLGSTFGRELDQKLESLIRPAQDEGGD